jgi:type I restriction enzyme, S subunit
VRKLAKKVKWQKYKFSEIAYNVVERIMPEPGDEETYIGLEHIDSGNLHITRWGSKTELAGEKLKIKKGDVLFGRRNAYLKRAAIAPFDGIFSAHGMVLRPQENVICKEFFPFFIISNPLMERAIQISVGSMSPTVNWGNLKNEEFLLPPIEDQQHIAELLWAADEVKEQYENAYNQLVKIFIPTIIREFYHSGNLGLKLKFKDKNLNNLDIKHPFPLPNGWKWVKVSEIAHFFSGYAFKSRNYVDKSNNQVIRIGNVKNNKLLLNEKPVFIPEEDAHKASAFRLLENDILVTMTGTKGKRDYFYTSLVGTQDLLKNDIYLNQRVGCFRCSNPQLAFYLNYILKEDFVLSEVFKHESGSANQGNISGGTIKNLSIPLPPTEDLNEFVALMLSVETTQEKLSDSGNKISQTLANLLNKFFEGGFIDV